MKKKLDLNGLLQKYQGISNTHSGSYYSPTKDYDYGAYVNKDPVNINPITDQDFYQSRQVNVVGEEVRYTQPITGNFQMSKSECEQFLMRVRDELRNEERGMQNFAQNAYKHLHEKFQANHEKIKREILELLDRAFKDNERYITEELRRQGSTEPAQFIPVHKRIANIDEDINRLLYGLKGADYRKSIAQTVLKDFSVEISGLKENVKVAKQSYLSGLGEVEPDRARIDCIREDLQRLFKIQKKTANLVMGMLSEAMGGANNGGGSGWNAREPDRSTAEQQQQQSQRQRKSFFNFAGF